MQNNLYYVIIRQIDIKVKMAQRTRRHHSQLEEQTLHKTK